MNKNDVFVPITMEASPRCVCDHDHLIVFRSPGMPSIHEIDAVFMGTLRSLVHLLVYGSC